MFAATGCRISEVLGLRWSDVDLTAKTVVISGKVIRAKGRGLIREGTTKTEAGRRVLPLPAFAIATLMGRQVAAEANPYDVVFPSQVGTLRDPDNCSKQWRRVRDALGFDWVTTHTFRKTLATIIDSEGMSARIGANQLGHRHVSRTPSTGRSAHRPALIKALGMHWTATGETKQVRGRMPSDLHGGVARAGIEPATFHFSGGRSYRLSYLASNERPDSDPRVRGA